MNTLIDNTFYRSAKCKGCFAGHYRRLADWLIFPLGAFRKFRFLPTRRVKKPSSPDETEPVMVARARLEFRSSAR